MPIQINAAINADTSDKELGKLAWQSTKTHHRKTLNAKVITALVLGSLTGIGLLITAPASAVILIKAYRSYRETLRLNREARTFYAATAIAAASLPKAQSQVIAARLTPEPTSEPPLTIQLNPYDKRQLDEDINDFENLLDNGRWEYAAHPGPYLTSMMELENAKKPGLNLVHCDTIEDLSAQINRCIDNGVQNAQFLVKSAGFAFSHTVAVSYQLVNGVPSVISFESAPFDGSDATVNMHYQLKDQLTKLNKDVRVSTVALNAQASAFQCAMFALNIAKQNWRHPKEMVNLHERHVAGEFGEHRLVLDNEFIRTEGVNDIAHLLPAYLLKHVQSGKRLNEIIAKNPDLANQTVNQKGETLTQYRDKHTRMAVIRELGKDIQKQRQASMFEKQLAYMKEVNAATKVEQAPQ